MTSELRHTEYIFLFVTGRPKNYEYRSDDTANGRSDTVCKVRGITLNYNASQLVNFVVIRDMILGMGEPTVTEHAERNIKLKRKGGVTLTVGTELEMCCTSMSCSRGVDEVKIHQSR